MKAKHVEIFMTIFRDDREVEVLVEGTVTEGTPARWYLSNGDPGYPAEDGETEIDSVSTEDGSDVELTDEETSQAIEKLLEASVDLFEASVD